jgi:hypothetical protein
MTVFISFRIDAYANEVHMDEGDTLRRIREHFRTVTLPPYPGSSYYPSVARVSHEVLHR